MIPRPGRRWRASRRSHPRPGSFPISQAAPGLPVRAPTPTLHPPPPPGSFLQCAATGRANFVPYFPEELKYPSLHAYHCNHRTPGASKPRFTSFFCVHLPPKPPWQPHLAPLSCSSPAMPTHPLARAPRRASPPPAHPLTCSPAHPLRGHPVLVPSCHAFLNATPARRFSLRPSRLPASLSSAPLRAKRPTLRLR